jgi:transposase
MLRRLIKLLKSLFHKHGGCSRCRKTTYCNKFTTVIFTKKYLDDARKTMLGTAIKSNKRLQIRQKPFANVVKAGRHTAKRVKR